MKRGFTLIELLVVIAIIGVLATAVISSISRARESAKVANTVSQFKEIEKAFLFTYLDENRSSWWTEGEIPGGNNPSLSDIISIESGPLSGFSNYFPHDQLTGIFNDAEYQYDNDGDGYICNQGHSGVSISLVNNDRDLQERIDNYIDGDDSPNCGKINYNGSRIIWRLAYEGDDGF